MTDDELDEIERRCAAARGGPWTASVEGRDHTSGSRFIMAGNDDVHIELTGATVEEQDFIAHARQDVPRLVAEVRRLRAPAPSPPGRTKLSTSTSGAVRSFAFWLANRTVGLPLLDGIDYGCIFEEPSALEQTLAIFVNVLELDGDGTVLNAKSAERRAAQFIRSYVDPAYRVDPPFEDWEVALH